MVDSTTSTLVTTSSTTYISGLSGFDSSSLIEAAVQKELAPAYALETEITEAEAQLASYSEMDTLISAMEESLNALRNEPGTLSDPSAFETRQAYLSSDDGSTASNYLGVSVAENTQPATYSVEIQQLATAHKVGSDTQAAQDSALGYDGVMSVGVGDTSADVTISADMTLEDIRDAINDQSNDSGVAASILKVSDNEYMLVLTAEETGQGISLTTTSGNDIAEGLGLVDGGAGMKNELQAVQNAIVFVDGVEIERSSNSIDDAIEGVTLDLYGAKIGTAFTLEVGYDYAGVKDELLAFVEAYNAYRDFALVHQEIDSAGNISADATLYGDDVLSGVNNDIYDMFGSTMDVDGVTYSLSSLGISLDSDNKLEVDEAEMDEFLLNNVEVVAQMFEFQMTSDNDSLLVLSNEGQYNNGDYVLDIQVDSEGDVTGVSVDGDDSLFEFDGNTITGASGSEFDGLVLVYAGGVDATINMSLSQGLADSLFNNLNGYTNAVDGTLTEARSNLEEEVFNNQNEIAEIEEAASNKEEDLISYYAALEAKIAEAEALSAYLEAVNNANNSD